MAILTRLARLLKADLHALLDRMEAPDVLLQQALRDMEAELQQSRQQQQQRQQQLNQMERLQQNLQQQLLQQQSELDLCLEEHNDNLLRVLMRRHLETRQQLQLLQTRQQDLQAQISVAEQEIQQQQTDFAALQTQAECWMTPTAATSQIPTNPPMVTEADIELALLKARRERSVS